MAQSDLLRRARGARRSRPQPTIAGLAEEAAACTRCHLYRNATQTVFGEGPEDARVVLVGEQPGDQEDRQGKPFVGPAGLLLDRALEAAGIDRRETYVTNAVKHFKFEPRGKRRIHRTPDRPEIDACHWWLEREIALVSPEIVVALGATAGIAVAGRLRPVRGGPQPGGVTGAVGGSAGGYPLLSNSSRPMSMRRISLVPAPIS